jgi:hypothetical protein
VTLGVPTEPIGGAEPGWPIGCRPRFIGDEFIGDGFIGDGFIGDGFIGDGPLPMGGIPVPICPAAGMGMGTGQFPGVAGLTGTP